MKAKKGKNVVPAAPKTVPLIPLGKTKLTIGDLKRDLRGLPEDAKVCVSLGGPIVTLHGTSYYTIGHNNQPTIVMWGSEDELPKGSKGMALILDYLGELNEKLSHLAKEEQEAAKSSAQIRKLFGLKE